MNDSIFENTLDKVNLGIAIYNSELNFIYLNRAEEGDNRVRSNMLGKSDFDLCREKNLDLEIASTRKKYLQKSIESKETIEYEEKYNLNGEVKYFHRVISPNFDSHMRLVNIIRQGRDITEMKKAILNLEYTANHDSLTGLPNRRLLYSRLTSELGNENRRDLLILLLDLDRFKTINDTLGHLIGDMLIKLVAKRILDLLKNYTDYLVSRLGGDEFVIVFFHDEAETSKVIYAKKILDCFNEPFHLGEHELFITTSIGVYHHLPTNSDIDIDSIIKHADIAMYKAKEAGRNKYRIYSTGMDLIVASKFTIETKLNQAIRNKEFLLHFQPRMSSLSKSVCSVEALLRWNLNSEILKTASFFETLEESGVLLLLTEWILKQAITENLEWQKLGLGKIPISINLSERQFYDDNLLDLIQDTVSSLKFSLDLLELEISENSIMKNPELSEEILNNIRKLGIKITLDDFGSGYSSLGKLKDYPIHTINVSKSLVRGVTENYQDAAVASAIVSMAHKLNINVNAEGIETKEQLEFMRYLRCEYFQGFYFAKPMSNLDIRKFILDKVKQLSFSI